MKKRKQHVLGGEKISLVPIVQIHLICSSCMLQHDADVHIINHLSSIMGILTISKFLN